MTPSPSLVRTERRLRLSKRRPGTWIQTAQAPVEMPLSAPPRAPCPLARAGRVAAYSAPQSSAARPAGASHAPAEAVAQHRRGAEPVHAASRAGQRRVDELAGLDGAVAVHKHHGHTVELRSLALVDRHDQRRLRRRQPRQGHAAHGGLVPLALHEHGGEAAALHGQHQAHVAVHEVHVVRVLPHEHGAPEPPAAVPRESGAAPALVPGVVQVGPHALGELTRQPGDPEGARRWAASTR